MNALQDAIDKAISRAKDKWALSTGGTEFDFIAMEFEKVAKDWAFEFQVYMESDAVTYDHQEQTTHSLDEHYRHFLETF